MVDKRTWALLAVAIFASCKDDADARRARANAEYEQAERARAAPQPAQPPATKKAPTLRARARDAESWDASLKEIDQATAIRIEDIAMARVIERCSPAATWLWDAGVAIEANVVFKGKFPTHRVNVFVTPPDPARTDGHSLLPFMITFDGSNAPQTIQATKDIAAKVCGLGAANTDYSL